MKTFIQHVAQHIFQTYGHDTQDLCVVLPGRRAHVYLRNELAKLNQRTQWAPAMFSAEDFVFTMLQAKPADPLDQLFLLYESYREEVGTTAQAFDEFLSWGQVMLSDFNEIDLYLVDAELLFGYISQARAIAMWNPGDTALTPFQLDYLQFYNSLAGIYKRFNAKLAQRKELYQGMAYQTLAEKVVHADFSSPWKHIVFAGFNALTPSEETILKTLEKSGKAVLLWDADSYYLNDKLQEAGTFLRQYLNDYPEGGFKWIENGIVNNPKQINIYGLSGAIGQVKTMGQLMQEMVAQNGAEALNNAVVILNDENLLLPALQSIPPEVETFNVTMGLSLAGTQAGSFADIVMGLLESTNLKEGLVPVHELIELLQHPYFVGYLKNHNCTSLPASIERVLASGRIFMPLHTVQEALFADKQSAFAGLEPLLLPGATSPEAICARISMAIDLVKPFVDKAMPLEFLYALAKAVAKLRTLVSKYQFGISAKSTRKIINRILAATTLPFYGEPLQGLQIMGMLETRTLDFDTVFLLSANDDVLPSSGRSASFIPFDIRIEGEFKLPVFRHKTAIFAYHFYHLLHRSSTMNIFYNTDSGNLGGGEQSRFVTQLMQELPNASASTVINHQLISEHPYTEPYTPWEFAKSPSIMALLHAKAKKGFAPSALNNYIQCPLLFYFKQVVGIADVQETGLEIDPARFGTFIHDALYTIYGGKTPVKPSPEFLKQQLEQVPQFVEAAFKNTVEGVDVAVGNNRLMYDVAIRIVKDFLEWEAQQLAEGNSLELVALEAQFEAELMLQDVEGLDKVLIKGRFDRVDQFNGITRIIDYKTGRFTKRGPSKTQDWHDILTDATFDKVFQLLVYAWVYHQRNPQSRPQAGILSFKELSEGFMTHTLLGEFEEHILQTQELLGALMKELFDVEVPFRQTNNPKNCEYCDFKNLCGRN